MCPKSVVCFYVCVCVDMLIDIWLHMPKDNMSEKDVFCFMF